MSNPDNDPTPEDMAHSRRRAILATLMKMAGVGAAGALGAGVLSPSVAQAATGAEFTWFDTIDGEGAAGATLASTPGVRNNQFAVALGYWSPGDGGDGLFYWDANSTLPGNGGTILQVAGVSVGRWKRLHAGPVSIQWFGAQRYPSNATAIIQTTLDAVHDAGGGTVYFPPGLWLVFDELRVHADTDLLGAASPMGETNNQMSRILTAEQFPANGSGIRLADTSRPNWGLSVEKLSVEIGTRNVGVVGVDLSGVSYGRIRQVAVTGQRGVGSVGFLFSDRVGFGCWWNVAEQVKAGLVETAFKYEGTTGNTSLNVLQDFQAIDVLSGVWTASSGGISLAMRNGYIANGAWSAAECKALKHTGGVPNIHAVQVGTEGFLANNDYDAEGELNIAGGWPISTAATFNAIVQVGALKVKLDSTYPRGTDPSNAIPPWPRPTAATPPQPQPIGPYALSYWAKIPAGTALVVGKNTFVFYSNANRHQLAPPPGMFFTMHVHSDGGLRAAISWSAKASVTRCTNGVNELTYDVSLYVPSAFRLTADLVFFLQASQATSGGAPFSG